MINSQGRLLLGALTYLLLAGCSSTDNISQGSPATGGTGGDTQEASTGGSGGTGANGGTGGMEAGAESSVPDAASTGCKEDNDCQSALPAETKPQGCAEAKCDTSTHLCVIQAKDVDGDGYKTNKCEPVGADVVIATGTDCDDSDPLVHPGAWDGPAGDGHANACNDGTDQNCSGADGDDVLSSGETCTCAPNAVSSCGETAAGVPIAYPSDPPKGECKKGAKTCTAQGTWGQCVGAIGPTSETCDGRDENCDGNIDKVGSEPPLDASIWVYDGDGDLHAAVDSPKVFACPSQRPTDPPQECMDAQMVRCAESDAPPCCPASCCPTGNWKPLGAVQADDCDDFKASVYPFALEKCNGIDDDCDDTIDDSDAVDAKWWYKDLDNDGWGDVSSQAIRSCYAIPGYQEGIQKKDCDDSNASINPDAKDPCDINNPVDLNCDGAPFSGCPCTPGASRACGSLAKCNLGTQLCENGAWGACSGGMEVDPAVFCLDQDTDGFCTTTCGSYCPSDAVAPNNAAPQGYRRLVGGCEGGTSDGQTPDAVDCVDTGTNAYLIHPGVDEKCNAIDDDCNNLVDDNAKGDTGLCSAGLGACFKAGAWLCVNGDPHGGCSAVAGTPTTELCNNLDDDCDGLIDDGYYNGDAHYPKGACLQPLLLFPDAATLSADCVEYHTAHYNQVYLQKQEGGADSTITVNASSPDIYAAIEFEKTNVQYCMGVTVTLKIAVRESSGMVTSRTGASGSKWYMIPTPKPVLNIIPPTFPQATTPPVNIGSMLNVGWICTNPQSLPWPSGTKRTCNVFWDGGAGNVDIAFSLASTTPWSGLDVYGVGTGWLFEFSPALGGEYIYVEYAP